MIVIIIIISMSSGSGNTYGSSLTFSSGQMGRRFLMILMFLKARWAFERIPYLMHRFAYILLLV